GIVSYCLIIYYQNYNSYNSGMVTVLCNRIGDIGILITMSIMIIIGRWDLVIFNGKEEIILLIILAAITKRALAIAAPTPVSALVHSSTLVTAGVYLMIRFNKFLIVSNIRFVLTFISVIFIAEIMVNFENDFKKIIALSTLRQLGFMIIILRFGYRILAYYHSSIHAIFKSILFIAAEAVIHIIKNTQDIRLLGNLNEIIPFVIRSIVSNMALIGVPFIFGFYRKDLIIEIVYREGEVNVVILILIIMSLLLTVSYSVRFFYYLFFNRRIKFYRYIYVKEDKLINLSMMIIIFLRVIVGSILN
ncbi:NADH-ubiquinone oxidoreductase chain 5, partial [Trachymyrmex septentrionalis]